MGLPQDAVALLSLLRDHEQAIEDLYRLHARCLREMEDFWMALAAEEAVHVGLLNRLAGQMAAGGATLAAERFAPESVQASLAQVHAHLARAREGPLSARHALTAAAEIEEDLLERRFFEVVAGDSAEARAVLRALAQGSFAHRDRVLAALLELGGPEPPDPFAGPGGGL